MKKILKFIGWGLLIILIGIQFIRPSKNQQQEISTNHISRQFSIPGDVEPILEKACYDCHTNNSRYPWYYNIQPVGIWMNGHIKEAKEKLNLSEFTDKRPRVQFHKMEEIIEMVKEKAMPITSYKWTHKDARLTVAERSKIMEWAGSVMDTLKTRHPIDSLVGKQP